MGDVDVTLLFRSARTERDRLMMRVAYYDGLRVSELVTLTWAQVIPRDSGEVQLALVGKGGNERNVLLPATLAAALVVRRRTEQAADRVFPITDRRFSHIVKATAKRAGLNTAASAHWFRHAHASYALDRGAPIYFVSQRWGTPASKQPLSIATRSRTTPRAGT